MEVREPSARYLTRREYKHTDAETVPSDWTVSSLADLYSFQNGVNADKGAYGHGVPFVNVLEIITRRVIDQKHVPGRVDLAEPVIAAFALKAGDVLFNRTSETQEEVGLASIYAGADVAVFGGFVIRARARGERLLPEFASYALRAPAVRAQIVARGQGVVRANIGQAELARVLLAHPDRVEQTAIAAALSDADALIESLEQLLAKKRQLKQGAMQELLTGKRRLPGSTSDWTVRPIGEVAPFQRGFDLPNGQLRPGRFPVVYSNGVLTHHAAAQVKGPGVVTGRSGTIGKVTYVDQDFWPHNTSLWVTSFRGNDPKFIYFLLSNIALDRFATGSGVPTLNRNDVHAHPVSVPTSVAEQTAIASLLSDLDSELEALQAQLTKARHLKQGMSQALLTGRIRLV